MAKPCKSAHHANSLTESLEELQKQDLLTDITINVDGHELKAHKAVLASSSGYFRSLFSHGFKESNVEEIQIDAFSEETISQLLKFCYSEIIVFSDENVIDLLQAALYFQIDDAVDLCFGFVNTSDCDCDVPRHYSALCKAASIADTHGMVEQFEKCCKRVAFWLIAIYKTETFLKWTTYGMLNKALDRMDLTKKRNYKELKNEKASVVSDESGYIEGQPKEKHVLEAVVGWLKYDWQTRKHHTAALLRKVRLGTIESQVLHTLISKEMQEMKECQEILEMVEKGRAENNGDPVPGDMFSPRGMIRVLLAVNTDVDSNNVVTTKARYFYHNDPEKDPDDAICWRNLPRLQPDPGFSYKADKVILVNNIVYVCHGVVRVRPWDEPNFSALDLRTCELTSIDFNHSFEQCALFHDDGWLYALEGNCNRTMYDPPMDEDDYDFNHAITATRYHLSNRIQEDLGPEVDTYPMSNPSVVTYKGHIIIYGQYSEGANLDQNAHYMYMYYPPTNKWSGLYELREEHAPHTKGTKVRLYSALVVHEDKCYRVTYQNHEVSPGTFKDTPQVNELIFDLESDPWTRRCQIGPALDQSALCMNNKDVQYQGEFCINNELFFNVKGNIIRTGHQMTRDDKDVAARKRWKNLFDGSVGEACITYGLINVNILE